MGFEGLGDLMRSRCLSQETPKPRRFSAEASLRRGALTEARTRELLSEVLQSVNGEGLHVFTLEQWFALAGEVPVRTQANSERQARLFSRWHRPGNHLQASQR